LPVPGTREVSARPPDGRFDHRTPAASPKAPVAVADLTDLVVSEIDRRIVAHRERLGRI